MIEELCEESGCIIKLQECNIKVFSIYRSPSGKIDLFFKNLEAALLEQINYQDKFILSGYLNIDSVKEKNCTRKLVEFAEWFGLDSDVLALTRIIPKSKTSIDFVLSYLKHSDNRNTVFNMAISDHCGINVLIDGTVPTPTKFTYSLCFGQDKCNFFVPLLS